MTKILDVIQTMEDVAPIKLAEDWDNVGFLVGDRERPCTSIMSCLTLTEDVADEAIEKGVSLIIVHHPLPFKGLRKISTSNVEGRILLKLIEARVGIYSAHSAYDSAALGINEQLCQSVGADNITPLVENINDVEVGNGRIGYFSAPTAISDIAASLKKTTGASSLKYIGKADKKVKSIAFACGSAGEFFYKAQSRRVDLFVTGETNFHTCLAARASSTKMLLLSHFYSERFAMESLAERLSTLLPDVKVFASHSESDPITLI